MRGPIGNLINTATGDVIRMPQCYDGKRIRQAMIGERQNKKMDTPDHISGYDGAIFKFRPGITVLNPAKRVSNPVIGTKNPISVPLLLF